MRRLVIRPGAIGDFIVSLPALECLRSRVPGGVGGLAECSAGAVRGSRARHRIHGARSVGRDRAAAAPAGRAARVRFDRVLVWREPARVSRAGRRARTAVHLSSGAAAARARRCTPRFLPGPGARRWRTCASDGIPRIRCAVEARKISPRFTRFREARAKNWPLEKYPRAGARGWSAPCRSAGAPGPEDPPLEGAVRIDDLYELACWLARRAACTSATIRASRIWPRPWERRCWRFSAPPIRTVGRRAGRTCGWDDGNVEPCTLARVTIASDFDGSQVISGPASLLRGDRGSAPPLRARSGLLARGGIRRVAGGSRLGFPEIGRPGAAVRGSARTERLRADRRRPGGRAISIMCWRRPRG